MAKKPFYHSEFESGLEKLAFEKPEQDYNVLDRVFSVRTKSLQAVIRALLKEIKIREDLDIHLIIQIEEEKSRLNSKLINLESMRTHYMQTLKYQIYSIKNQLKSNLLELDREKRREYLQCWHDLLGLKRELLGALREFWDLTKKKEILWSDFGT